MYGTSCIKMKTGDFFHSICVKSVAKHESVQKTRVPSHQTISRLLMLINRINSNHARYRLL